MPRRSSDGKLIYMSSVTDAYQPVERKLQLTGGLPDVLAARHRPKLVVQTRSPDVVGDADLLREIVARGGRVQVNLTVTTDDEDVRKAFEPLCPGNGRRLEAATALVHAGLDACVTMTPLLLVRDARRFAEDLLATGVKDFIAQPFHSQRGRFVAGTRDSALARRVQAGRGPQPRSGEGAGRVPQPGGDAPATGDRTGWEALLRNLDLMTEAAGEFVAAVDGVLLFGKEPNRHVPQAGVRAICYPGTEPDYATRADEDLRGPMAPLAGADGPLIGLGLVDAAWDFVRRNTTPTARIEGMTARSPT